jgi:hypothetical protein
LYPSGAPRAYSDGQSYTARSLPGAPCFSELSTYMYVAVKSPPFGPLVASLSQKFRRKQTTSVVGLSNREQAFAPPPASRPSEED